MNDDSGEAPVVQPEPSPNLKTPIAKRQVSISQTRVIKLSLFEEAILHAKPSNKPEPDHSKTAWPKREATILAEEKENPGAPVVVKRFAVSELRAWTFYGEEINE